MRTNTGELTVHAREIELLAKSLMPLPEKYHGLADTGDPLPATPSRSHRQRGVAGGVPHPFPAGCRAAPVLRRARLPRSRDPDDAPDSGRRDGAPVRHPPQRAGQGALPAGRPGALSQALGGRRLRAGLRDQPLLPQRGPLAPAQPGVHHRGVLPGVRRLPRPDGPHGGTAASRPRGNPGRHNDHPRRHRDRLRRPDPEAPHGGRRGG